MVTLGKEHINMLFMMAINARRTRRTLSEALSKGQAPSDLVAALQEENAEESNLWLFENLYAIAERRDRPSIITPANFCQIVDEAWEMVGNS